MSGRDGEVREGAAKRSPGQVLRENRARDSRVKRARVLAALDEMAGSGEEITFLAVARRAEVSRWLVYADGVREHIEKAIKKQAGAGRREVKAGSRASAESLATDLELAKAELKSLRAERDRLKAGMERSLGARLEAGGTKDLIARIQELTVAGQALAAERDGLLVRLRESESERDRLREDLEESEENLASALKAGREMFKRANLRGSQTFEHGGPTM